MFEKILLPLDGSRLAETAIPYAEELSRRLGSELVLVHVFGPEHRQYERELRVYLDGVAETINRGNGDGGGRGQVSVQIEDGQPSESICSLVEQTGVGLIVMTSTGGSGARIGKLLGSVADGVCRTVQAPVMLVRPATSERRSDGQLINRMIVTLDGSELSKQALPITEELAGRLAIPVVLYQMARVIRSYGGEPAPFVDYGKLTEEEEQRVRSEMLALEKELREKGLDATSSVTSGTDAAGEIMELSESSGADMVVMSTHGRGGLSRLVFGSVAEKVLRHGRTPLLLVHAKAAW